MVAVLWLPTHEETTLTLIALTRLAVLLATSLALCTKWRLATGLDVLDDAKRQALHSAEVCLATTVAAERTWGEKRNICIKQVLQNMKLPKNIV